MSQNSKHKHTALPWHMLDGSGAYQRISIISNLSDDAQVICRIDNKISQHPLTEEDKSNAEFIARACNSHYELVEALKGAAMTAHGHNKNFCNGAFSECHNCKEWRSIIARATGQEVA